MAVTAGKAIDAEYLLKQLKNYDTQVAEVKYNEKFQLASMPTAEAKYVGKYIQYIGTTTDDYNKGYFYTCVQNAEDQTYSWVAVTQSAPEYTIKKLDDTTEGFAATYQLVKDDKEIGAKIDIPKDFFVKDAKTGVVSAADKEPGGKFADKTDFSVGDTYIELDVNIADGSEPKPVYINVSSLVDTYVAGDGIEIDSDTNKISAKIGTNAGLKFADLKEGETEKALAVDLATDGGLKIATEGSETGIKIDFETVDIDFENDWNN